MCENYFDIRTFGAVMTTFVKGALNCGQVRGPVQLSFARSVNPIVPQEVTITRVAITTEADAEKKGTEMGRKHIVPYALYRAEGYVSANLARKTTGFSEDDLKLLWTAILNMFENDHTRMPQPSSVPKNQYSTAMTTADTRMTMMMGLWSANSLTQRREMSRSYLSTLMDWLALPMIFRLME